jgi:long-chain fatty acid transport protein
MMAFRSRRCSSQTFLFALFIMIVLKGKGSAQGLRIVGPGSRASSLGEAFTALADDASAIYWNPAGLTGAQRREISLSCEESYSWKTMRLRMASWGNERRPDIESRASRNTLGFGLVGVVIPFGKGWVGGFGVYHPVNSETRWSGTDLSPLTANRPDIQWSGRVGITSISTALAYRIDEHFAIGASLILNAGRFGFNRYGGIFWRLFPILPIFKRSILANMRKVRRAGGSEPPSASCSGPVTVSALGSFFGRRARSDSEVKRAWKDSPS